MDAATARSDADQASSRREVRLRAEFASDYPEIQVETWMSPQELAERLVERTYARRRQQLYTRTFDPRHFEFRGGELHGLRCSAGPSHGTPVASEWRTPPRQVPDR